ncbi:MAG: hypothetical protein EOP04_07050 [Proteobacteria bacterium]|nr:MAG: hypothetical protein EOP04_07050 [Pseudomonadota bacterium]
MQKEKPTRFDLLCHFLHELTLYNRAISKMHGPIDKDISIQLAAYSNEFAHNLASWGRGFCSDESLVVKFSKLSEMTSKLLREVPALRQTPICQSLSRVDRALSQSLTIQHQIN